MSNRNSKLIVVCTILTLLVLLQCKAEQKEQELQNLLDRLCKDAEAPGGVLAVANGDQISSVASGYADREAKKLLTKGSAYFLGSISKTYTAVTVLRLVEEERLSLDDKIARFLPSFPDGTKISVRQLLNHTSGLKDFYLHLYFRPDREEMIELVTKYWTQDELIALSGKFGRWFEPGTDWDYSNTNYFLLGVIIERVSGLSLPNAYRQYIYEPLGINQTWLTWHEDARMPLPVGYLGPVDGWIHSEMFGKLGATTVLDQSPVEWGAGGLAAPAEDSIRFLRGLFSGKLLTSKSMKAMTNFRSTPPLGITQKEIKVDGNDGYGLGLAKMKLAGFTLLGHGGLFTGHTTGLWYVPECDITIALYFNRGFVNQRKALEQILKLLTKNLDCAKNV